MSEVTTAVNTATNERIKVLTLHQPYATLVALGIKTIETRPMRTNVRGRIAIHAAARTPEPAGIGDWKSYRTGDRGPWRVEHFASGMGYPLPGDGDVLLPLGVIVATADLVDCVHTDPRKWDNAYGWRGSSMMGDGTEAHMYYKGHTWDWDSQRPYGNFTWEHYAWLLADVQPLADPVPFKGGQGWSRSIDASLLPAPVKVEQ